ncbi:MAG: tetratricopeptide repeat protein [Burkholderiaceae bacterium]
MPLTPVMPGSSPACSSRRRFAGRLAVMTGVAVLGLGMAGCSDYHRARRAYEVGRFTEALQILEKLAEGGDAKAQYEIALMYLQGIGTRVDPARGGYWMLAAANNGNVVAMVEIGGRFESGANVERNYLLSFTWYRRAAALEDPIAAFRLAGLYERGAGVQRDLPRAWAWYRMSRKFGNPIAIESTDRVWKLMDAIERVQAESLFEQLKSNPQA